MFPRNTRQNTKHPPYTSHILFKFRVCKKINYERVILTKSKSASFGNHYIPQHWNQSLIFFSSIFWKWSIQIDHLHALVPPPYRSIVWWTLKLSSWWHVTHYVFCSTNWITTRIDAFFCGKKMINLNWKHQSKDSCEKWAPEVYYQDLNSSSKNSNSSYCHRHGHSFVGLFWLTIWIFILLSDCTTSFSWQRAHILHKI